jgi:hypothetical protein
VKPKEIAQKMKMGVNEVYRIREKAIKLAKEQLELNVET